MLIRPDFSGNLNKVYPRYTHSGSRPHLRLNRRLIPLAKLALYFPPRHRFMIGFILFSLSILVQEYGGSFIRDYKAMYLNANILYVKGHTINHCTVQSKDPSEQSVPSQPPPPSFPPHSSSKYVDQASPKQQHHAPTASPQSTPSSSRPQQAQSPL